MADRYWVGGSGVWNTLSITNWSATSGGPGGASAPTIDDDVFLDANSGTTSAVTVNINGGTCRSLNCTGFGGVLSGSSSFVVRGSVTLSPTMTYSFNQTLSFEGTTDATFDSAGKKIAGPITIGKPGYSLRLTSALTSNSTITIGSGDFNTDGFSASCTQVIFSGNSIAKSFSLGSSTVTISNVTPIVTTSSSNYSINAGTSTIVCTGAITAFNLGTGGAFTLHNLSFTNTSARTIAFNSIFSYTFNRLTVAGPASAGLVQVTFAQTNTFNDGLATTGTAGNRRVWFRGTEYGIARTLIVNGAGALTDADFRDIYITGSAAPISGTRIGNLRGCRGITFSTPKTVYYYAAQGRSWSTDNTWSLTSIGPQSNDAFPLAQDTAVFQNVSPSSGATVTLDSAIPYTGSVVVSGRTDAITFQSGAIFTIYGNWTNSTNTTFSGSSGLTFSGRNTQTITSAGRPFSCPITIDSYGGTVQLADALSIGTNTLTVTNGTFDTKNYNVTANRIISNNTNIRGINLGSSTLTLTAPAGAIDFSTTNFTFDAGSSQINITFNSSGSSSVSFGGLTYNNVTIRNQSDFNFIYTITGENTFNNFTYSGLSTNANIQTLRFDSNQKFTGTLNVAGAAANRRTFVRSSVSGTPRILTVNNLSADDCDFLDITIVGSALGTAPTRAGNCGNNSGIIFPEPKTVYWNLSGTQNWGAIAWATSSGGTPAIQNFPLPQDTAIFDNSGAAGTVTINTAWNIGSFDSTTRTTAMSISIGSAFPNLFGSWSFGTGVTPVSSTGLITFAGRANTQTITSNGVTFQWSLTLENQTGTVQLADALFLASNRTITFTSGTFDALTYNLTSGAVSCSFNSLATIYMGSGTWTLTGTGSVWNFQTAPAFFSKGTANILLSDTSTTSRTFAGASLSYNKLTIGGTTGISTTTITGNNTFTEIDSIKTVAHTIAFGTTTQTFGKWSVTGTAGNVVTLTGTGTGHILAGPCTSNINYLAMGSIGFSASSPGEFYAGPNSTGTAAAPVYRTAKPADSVRYWVGGTGNWSNTARWSTSSGGAGGASVPRSHDDVVFDSASSAVDYTATIDAVTGGVRVKSLTISGPASGSLTLAGSEPIVGVHGNFTLPSTGLIRSYAGTLTFSGNTSCVITTNGYSLASNMTINGVGSTWSLGSAMSSTGGLVVQNGSINTNNFSLTVPSLSCSVQNTVSINLTTSTVTLSNSLNFQNSNSSINPVNLTFDAGTSNIVLSSNSATFYGGNKTFYNISFTSTIVGSRWIYGSNTFNDVALTTNGSGVTILELNENQTINGTFSTTGSNVERRGFIRSTVIGIPRVLNIESLSVNNCDFRDITIAGTASGSSLTTSGDCGGNNGIIFSAPKTVYRVGNSNIWSNSNSWAVTSGGIGDSANFPLAHDTAIIDDNTTVNNISLFYGYNIGTLDCSSRTIAFTLNYNASAIWYGSHILSSSITPSGGSAQTFSGRGAMTFISAGKTISSSITVDTPSGIFQLGDAFSSTSGITLNRGTFDAVSYNVTCTTFTSNISNIRTIKMGSGVWSLFGTGAVWNLTTQPINLTFDKGTANIILTSSSTSSRTFTGSGLSYNKLTIGGETGVSTLTIDGNNTFAEIASTKTVAHTISLVTSTQKVGSWTVKGSSGNLVTVTASSTTNPANLIFTGTGQVTTQDVDYLNIIGIRAYSLIDTWYAGANSINNGSLGWYFEAGAAPPITASNAAFLLLFGN